MAVCLDKDGSVSSLHAELSFHDNCWWISDCGSAAGTYLLIEDRGRSASVGDVIRIARTELQLFACVRAYESAP